MSLCLPCRDVAVVGWQTAPPNSDVEADVALGRSAPSGPRSSTPVVRQTQPAHYPRARARTSASCRNGQVIPLNVSARSRKTACPLRAQSRAPFVLAEALVDELATLLAVNSSGCSSSRSMRAICEPHVGCPATFMSTQIQSDTSGSRPV